MYKILSGKKERYLEVKNSQLIVPLSQGVSGHVTVYQAELEAIYQACKYMDENYDASVLF